MAGWWYDKAMTENEFYKAIENRAVQGAYLLCGEEELTKAFLVSQVKKLLEPSLADMNSQTLRGPTPEAFLAAVDQLPFFDERRLVLVEGFDEGFLEELARRGRLTEYPDTTLVLFLQRGNARTGSRLYQALNKQGRVVVCKKLDKAAALNKLIRDSAKYQVGLDRAAALLLIDRVGLDGYRLSNEFSKAALFVGRGGTVTEKVVAEVTTPSAEFVSFAILDALLEGRRKEGYALLAAALNRGDSPMALAGLFIWRFKQLLVARECLDLGMGQEQIQKQLGGNPKAAYYVIKSARRQTTAALRRGLTAFTRVSDHVRQGIYQGRDALLLAALETFE